MFRSQLLATNYISNQSWLNHWHEAVDWRNDKIQVFQEEAKIASATSSSAHNYYHHASSHLQSLGTLPLRQEPTVIRTSFRPSTAFWFVGFSQQHGDAHPATLRGNRVLARIKACYTLINNISSSRSECDASTGSISECTGSKRPPINWTIWAKLFCHCHVQPDA